MSGGIRQAAGPTHARLQRILANLPILQQPAPGAPQREVQHQLQNSLAAHQHALQQLQEAITLLSKREDQWLELLQRADIDRERLSSVPSLTNPPPTNAAASTVHLPKMDLKTFDGRLQDWPAFWDWYQSAIDSQPIPELQKLMYLKSCLKGSAATLRGAYALSTHAHTTFVDALKKRYERPEAIVNALYDELDDLPRACEGQLAELTENINRILELLAHQGEPTNTCPVRRIIERKLPKRALEKLEQAKGVTRQWTVDLMRENLAAMVIADENIARALPHDPISERTKRTKEDVNLNLVDLMRENLAAMVIADENIARALPHDPTSERTKRTKEGVNLNLDTSALMNLNVGEKRHSPPEKRKPNGERTCSFCNRCGHKPHECRTLSTPESRIATASYVKIQASFCTNITRTVCTKTFFVWELKVTKDEVTVEGVPPEECRNLAKNKGIWVDGKKLQVFEESPGRWRSHNPTEYAYGWIGTRCYSVTNLLLEESDIISYDGEHAIVDIGVPKTCLIQDRKCEGTRSTAVWNLEVKKCLYEAKGQFTMWKRQKFLRVPELQATFRLKSEMPISVPECNLDKVWQAENGFLILIRKTTRVKRTKGKDEEDRNNPKYQFLFDELKKRLDRHKSAEEIHRCHLMNHLRTIVRWIAATDTNTAARILMERNDVVATKVEGQLLIYACEGGRHLHPPNNYTAVDKVRGLIFDAPTLSRFETEKLAAPLQQLRLKIGQSSLEPGHMEMKKIIFDKVRDVGEQALREIQSDLGHTGESLARSIEDVVSHWRLCLTLAVMAALGIVTTAICFYCEGARLMCCILARRVRRRKEERRKSKASVPRKADVARTKTFEAASDKGRPDEAHNAEGALDSSSLKQANGTVG
uniref:Integrase catalytic domain-containing protein n=1 Tax=Ascaris lumbricoides TaxID=6252 RepID=A0A0M3IKE4_ASCLU